MRTRLVLGSVVVVLAAWVGVSVAAADGYVGLCGTTETALSGSYTNYTVTGDAYVPGGETLVVRGNLTIAPGACLDAFTMGTVTVGANVKVGDSATLALGCSLTVAAPPNPCTGTTNDTVGGSILASDPWTMYLSDITVHGSVISRGGGPGVTFSPYVNFPIKESTIGGNLNVSGWQGAWFGVLRNHVGGTVHITNVQSANPDGNEVATNTIGGSLICRGNSPATQIGDSGGSPNTVGGRELGQCAGL